MLRINDVRMPLNYGETDLRTAVCAKLRVREKDVVSVRVLRRSVDARKRDDITFLLSLAVELKNEKSVRADKNVAPYVPYCYPQPPMSALQKRPVVVGAGPAGLFCALILAQRGARPILLERGLEAEKRTEKVQTFWLTGQLDPECNVQFGEGGAGTFSDGKLNTGTKDSRIRKVLAELVESGAPTEIEIDAKPHIGTDLLAPTVINLRKRIIALGGEVLFGAKMTDFITDNGRISGVVYLHDGSRHHIETEHLVLAVGHSARDTFELLQQKGVLMTQKPFAVGMRIEHLQTDLDRAMYGKFAGHPRLGAADYKLAVHLPDGTGVYTFCMCPGGEVVAAASEPGRLVTNGMSRHARSEQNANSAVLVGVDAKDFGSEDPLAGMHFQRELEQKAFAVGGGDYRAPMTTVGDLLARRPAKEAGRVQPSYRPGVTPVMPEEYLPARICEALRAGVSLMGKRIAGFDDAEAVMTGVESRSSSPVRIVRDEKLQSVSVGGLYPCGEGAGYAGGIVSAAVDGIRCAEQILGMECTK
ncbi:MAG: hypothetical protein IJC25_07510 [Clostridia bacterium]|nr:hypothetical protein [Clostridia bacterium]